MKLWTIQKVIWKVVLKVKEDIRGQHMEQFKMWMKVILMLRDDWWQFMEGSRYMDELRSKSSDDFDVSSVQWSKDR